MRTVQLRVESIVHGGEGLARHQGRVVFVRGSAPGDLVEVELPDDAPPGPAALALAAAGMAAKSRERFLRARVLRVLDPGPERVAAPCPVVERCGGCPIQQLSLAGQHEVKRALAVDALEHLGGLAPESYQLAAMVPSPAALRYRRRARLHRGPQGSWGFAGAPESEEAGGERDSLAPGAERGALAPGAERRAPVIVPIAECLLFEPALQDLADRARVEIAALGGLPDVLDLGLDTSDSGKGAIDLRTAKAPSPSLRKKARALLARVRGLRGLTLGPPGAPELLGDPVLVEARKVLAGAGGAGASGATALGWRLRSRPDLFAQANRAAVPLLQAAALEALGDAAQGRVLELFCGAGTLTLPLLAAGAGAVIGVEGAPASLALLRKSADEAGLSDAPRLQLIAGDAVAVTRGLLARERGRLDAVLLDPPRTGAPDAVRAAAALEAPRLVYVSCDAPTLGRDAQALAQMGYRLQRAVPLDLFPQTAHFELVATFVVRTLL